MFDPVAFANADAASFDPAGFAGGGMDSASEPVPERAGSDAEEYKPYTGLTRFERPDSWRQYGAVLEAKQRMDQVLATNRPDLMLPDDMRRQVEAYNAKFSDAYRQALIQSNPEVQEAVRRDELFNEAKLVDKQLRHFENAPNDYPAKVKLQARMDEINDELHLSDDSFMVRAKSGRAGSWVDTMRYGRWSTNQSQRLADALAGGNYRAVQQYVDDLNEVEAAVSKTLPQGKGRLRKAWYGFLGSAAPMGESIAVGAVTAGTADKAYWARAGMGEIFRTWLESDGRKVSEVPRDELERATKIAMVGGAIYGGVEYASGLVPGLKQTGIPWADKFAKRFIKEAWDNPALVNRLMKGGIRTVFSWLGETAEEGAQKAVVDSANDLMNNEAVTLYDASLSALEGAWEAKDVTALMALAGSGGGAAMDRLSAISSDRNTQKAEGSQSAPAKTEADAVQGESFDPVAFASGGVAVADAEGEQVVLDMSGASDNAAASGPMRGFAGRVAQNERLTPEQQDSVRNNPENYYDEQHYDEMGDVLEGMSREDKLRALDGAGSDGAVGNDNLGVMAGLSVMDEEIAAGRDPGWIVESLAKKGTTIAQLLAQYRLLKSANPEYSVQVFESALEKDGLYLRPEQRESLWRLVDADLKAAKDMATAAREMRENPTDQTVDAYLRAERAAFKAKQLAFNKMAGYSSRSMADMFKDSIRGNLLTPKSHKRNLVSNVLMRPIADVAQLIGSVVDAVDAHISGRNRELQRPSVRGSAVGAARGFRQAGQKMLRGSVEENMKTERQQGFQPVQALKQLMRNDLAVDENGKVPLRSYVRKLWEGTFGIAPEINFRLLTLGDDPFKQSAYLSSVEMEARKRGLGGAARRAFVANPPVRVRKAAMDHAENTVFQQSNLAGKTAGFFRKGVRSIPVVGQWLDAAVLTPLVPYVNTPANVAKTLFKLAAPELTAPVGMAQMQYGKSHNSKSALRRGEMNLGYAAIGAVLRGAAAWLIKEGLVSEPMPDDEKERTLSYQTTKPGQLNVSALRRRLNGESVEWRDGDEVVNMVSLGFPGAVIQIQSHVQQLARTAERRKGALAEGEDVAGVVEQLPYHGVAALQAVLDQSFVQGIYDSLKALSENQADRWLKTVAGAEVSAVLPNTLSAITRAGQEYIPDTKLDMTENSVVQALRNAINERNPFVDWDEVYPHRFDPLGNPIQRVPDGVPPFLQQLWSDKQVVDMDPRWREIRRVYEESGERGVLPVGPDRSITVPNGPLQGERLPLSNEQYERYSELVGKARGDQVAELIRDERYLRLSTADQAAALKDALENGSRIGRAVFVAEVFKGDDRHLRHIKQRPLLSDPQRVNLPVDELMGTQTNRPDVRVLMGQ